MRRRTRKFVGTIVMLVFVCAYALTVMALAEGRIQQASTLWLNVFYVVMGLAWIVPLMPLIAWMERPDEDDIVENP
jgi:quinol-cytochrome oxidoreductase complex cytochrome b subunit